MPGIPGEVVIVGVHATAAWQGCKVVLAPLRKAQVGLFLSHPWLAVEGQASLHHVNTATQAWASAPAGVQ
jgi:hypothetical protein